MSGGAGRVHSIQVSSGGAPKRAVARARIGKLGLEGDRQRNLKFHGGPDRAVCLFSLEVIERLRAEGHPIEPGSTGENLTLAGLDWAAVVPGARLRIGADALLEVTQHTKPCATVAASFQGGAFQRIAPREHPHECRLYARVLAEGDAAPGDPVELLPPRAALARKFTSLRDRLR